MVDVFVVGEVDDAEIKNIFREYFKLRTYHKQEVSVIVPELDVSRKVIVFDLNNLISYNETNNISFKASSKENIDMFYDTLKKCGINVTVRRKFGNKISAACGQLRSKEV